MDIGQDSFLFVGVLAKLGFVGIRRREVVGQVIQVIPLVEHIPDIDHIRLIKVVKEIDVDQTTLRINDVRIVGRQVPLLVSPVL
jgi:hypothetical protein